jgi:hypothetical protein
MKICTAVLFLEAREVTSEVIISPLPANIKGVSEGTVNILGGGSMNYSE